MAMCAYRAYQRTRRYTSPPCGVLTARQPGDRHRTPPGVLVAREYAVYITASFSFCVFAALVSVSSAVVFVLLGCQCAERSLRLSVALVVAPEFCYLHRPAGRRRRCHSHSGRRCRLGSSFSVACACACACRASAAAVLYLILGCMPQSRCPACRCYCCFVRLVRTLRRGQIQEPACTGGHLHFVCTGG